MFNQPKTESRQERISRLGREAQEEIQRERDARLKAEAEAAASYVVEQEEAAGRAAQAERVRLAEIRDARLTKEEFDSLSPKERAEWNAEYNVLVLMDRYAVEARKVADERRVIILEAAKKMKLEEARKTRKDAPYKMYKILQEVDQWANDQAQKYLAERSKRELEAENQPDKISRLIASMDETERVEFSRLWDNHPSALDTIRAVKQKSAQKQDAAKQAELRAQFEKEVKSTHAHGGTWVANIRRKYYALGMRDEYR